MTTTTTTIKMGFDTIEINLVFSLFAWPPPNMLVLYLNAPEKQQQKVKLCVGQTTLKIKWVLVQFLGSMLPQYLLCPLRLYVTCPKKF